MQILSFLQQITATFCINSIGFIEVKSNEIFDKKCQSDRAVFFKKILKTIIFFNIFGVFLIN